MHRIDRYLLKEMLVPAFIGGVLVLMLLVGNWLYILLRLLYTGSSGIDILRVLLYRLPNVFMTALPASLLLGVALGVNRLERDRELMSLRMTGVRLTRLVTPYIVVGIVFSGVLFALQEKIMPPATHAAEMLTRKLMWGSPTAVAPQDVVFKVGQDYMYVRQVDPVTQTLYGVVVCKIDQGPTWLTIPVAENHRGQWFFKRDPVTHELPKLYIFKPGSDPVYGEIEGKGYLNLQENVMSYISDQPSTADELNFDQLQELLNGIRGSGVGAGLMLAPAQLTFQLHRKIAAPLAALVAVLIAIPLAVLFGRSGGYTGLLLSVVVAFCFVVSQQWAQVLAETNRLQPIFAAWAPDGLFGLLGIILLLMEE